MCVRKYRKHATNVVGSVCVVDPNTLNLVPDQGFCSNLAPDPGLYNQF